MEWSSSFDLLDDNDDGSIVSPPLSTGEPKITHNFVADTTSRETPVGAPGITIGATGSGALTGREYPSLFLVLTLP